MQLDRFTLGCQLLQLVFLLVENAKAVSAVTGSNVQNRGSIQNDGLCENMAISHLTPPLPLSLSSPPPSSSLPPFQSLPWSANTCNASSATTVMFTDIWNTGGLAVTRFPEMRDVSTNSRRQIPRADSTGSKTIRPFQAARTLAVKSTTARDVTTKVVSPWILQRLMSIMSAYSSPYPTTTFSESVGLLGCLVIFALTGCLIFVELMPN